MLKACIEIIELIWLYEHESRGMNGVEHRFKFDLNDLWFKGQRLTLTIHWAMMQSANMQNSNYSENSNILYARNSNFQGTYDAFYNRSNDVVQTSPEQDSSTIRYRAGITNDTPYGGGSNLPEDTSVEANTGHGTSNPQARRLSSTEQSIQQVDASTPTKHKSGSKWKLWKSTPSQNDTNQTIQESDEVKSMQSQIFELRLEQQKMKSQIRDKETRERNITQALDHTTQEKQGLEKRLTDVQTRHSEYISRQRIEYQDAIDNAIQEKQALEKRSTDLQTQHIERINRQRIEHQGAIDKKDDEIRVIRRQLEEKSQEIVKRDKSTTQMKETHLKTIEKLHKDYASKLQKLREEHEEAIRQESKQRADLEANHELDRNTHIRQKEEDIKKLKQAQATRITGLKEQNEKKLKEMEKKGESMRAFIKQLKIQHSTAIEDQEQSHRTTLEDQQKAYEMREAETVRDHQQVKSNLISEHREKERKLIAESAKRIQNLNEELADLSEALLARDNDTWTAPPLSMVAVRKDPDEHITGDFEQVAELVSSLVELEWKNPRSLWTDDLLARLDPGCGQRKLKQNVLRNIIWEALEEHIFESPFRLFGDEGRTLETQWSERYGAGMCPNKDQLMRS